jgi:hypothetical protein
MSVSIDPLSPDTLTLAQAARLLPSLRGGRPVHPSTLWRWASNGIAGVRLPIIRIGGTACTTRDALRRFLADVEAARRPSPLEQRPAQTAPTPSDQAAAALGLLGI